MLISPKSITRYNVKLAWNFFSTKSYGHLHFLEVMFLPKLLVLNNLLRKSFENIKMLLINV